MSSYVTSAMNTLAKTTQKLILNNMVIANSAFSFFQLDLSISKISSGDKITERDVTYIILSVYLLMLIETTKL